MLINDLTPYQNKINIVKELLVNDILNDKYLTKLEKIILICDYNLYRNGWCRKDLKCDVLNRWLKWRYKHTDDDYFISLYEIILELEDFYFYFDIVLYKKKQKIIEKYPTNEDLVNHIYDVMIMDKISTLNLSNY